jgi:predicted phosphodiesterase
VTVIAAVSDVHGNTAALKAVLAEIERRDVDITVNLGDIASGGVDPRGTLDLLRARPDIITVRGNHERQLLTIPPADLGASDHFAYAKLLAEDREWLKDLPDRVELTDTVLAFHGSPDDDLCYLLETVDPTVAGGLREATDNEVLERLGSDRGKYALYLCGHTHLQRTRHLPDGSLVINPGSVGWPAYEDDRPAPHAVQAGTSHARFSIISDDGNGSWSAEQCAIDYDVEEAAALAERNNRSDVAHALRFGTVA